MMSYDDDDDEGEDEDSDIFGESDRDDEEDSKVKQLWSSSEVKHQRCCYLRVISCVFFFFVTLRTLVHHLLLTSWLHESKVNQSKSQREIEHVSHCCHQATSSISSFSSLTFHVLHCQIMKTAGRFIFVIES